MEARGLTPAAGWSRLRLPGAPVLLYHAVEDGPGDRYTVPRAALAAHLDRILAGGYDVVSLSDLHGRRLGSPRAVVVTFDDGRASDHAQAFPLLEERGLAAEFFVNPATVGGPGFVTWAQLREMAAGGQSIQSHAYDHRPLTLLGARELRRQVGDSRRAIEDGVGRPVRFLAVPYGDVNPRVVDAALECGYRAVCTSWPWPARGGGRTVNRIAVHAGASAETVARMIARHPWPYLARAARAAALLPAKHALRRLRPAWGPGATAGRA
jgi:peptidoglycan/xylan/chitin deacetylase (PgdA/CDA1 family)